MNNKYLFCLTFLVVISLVSLFSALRYLDNKAASEVLGSYTFTGTKNNLYKLGKIKMTDSDGEEINIYYDKMWYFAEAADYFVNEQSIRSFFEAVDNSVLIKNFETEDLKQDFINIKTYDTEDNLLDDIYIAKDNPEIIKYAGRNNLYQATKIDLVPLSAEQWMPYPLLSVEEGDISAVNINGFYAQKNMLDEIKPFNKTIEMFFAALQEVNYGGIIEESLFDEEYADAPVKEIKVYLEGGFDYVLKIYHTVEGYYLKIVPQRELIAHMLVNKVLEIKKLYYEGWLFLLDEEQGKLFFDLDTEINEPQ